MVSLDLVKGGFVSKLKGSQVRLKGLRAWYCGLRLWSHMLEYFSGPSADSHSALERACLTVKQERKEPGLWAEC